MLGEGKAGWHFGEFADVSLNRSSATNDRRRGRWIFMGLQLVAIALFTPYASFLTDSE